MTEQPQNPGSTARIPWPSLPWLGRSALIEVPIFILGTGLVYGVVELARYWSGPLTPQVEIDLSARALPLYALYSVLRISIAYFLSLAFTLVYGYVAAYNRRAERFMIPLLDVLQSIPVLSFLPGVMLAMVALFPSRQLGVELGSILLIFTGQVWNMAFSFYSSLKSIPREMREAARLYRFSWWQRFTQMELPYSVIGLVWNSMMSVAGGWFFLMACEMFVLGKRDFRLPGLGSYLQTAASAGNTRAIVYGLATMIAVIVVADLLVWRPIVAWAQKFKFESVEAAETTQSPVLTFIRRSQIVDLVSRKTIMPLREALLLHFAREKTARPASAPQSALRRWLPAVLGVVFLGGALYLVFHGGMLLAGLTRSEVMMILKGLAATFLRVTTALVLASLWTVPAGVAIGTHPRLARIAQPLAQIAASVPATALFPVVLLALVSVGGGMGIASMLLLLLGTQWYLLFNVIAGASAIPTELVEACTVFRFSRWERWTKLILPAIFPYLITALVTASGGAWNASIVAEYFHLKGRVYSTVGLGALISQASDEGNFRLLFASTIFMAGTVVTINRLLWRRLYKLAATRFKLEM
ncbi:MAG TPA: ABC transporter permease subunit [Candidatus Angelobacter sp.]|nr:ABC transporter permease subunit [Candidatus Angelobacter sp.]